MSNTTIAKQFHTKSVRAKENPAKKAGNRPLYTCTYRGSPRTIVVLATKYGTTNGTARDAVNGFIKGAKGKHIATVNGVGEAASSFEFSAGPGRTAVGVSSARKESDGIVAISVFTPKGGKVLPALVATTKAAMH